ncbi:unnamed protein product [Orchesella dallaii]|uniref:Uncharacterized protein n=1 Tax=Orchesella dallaii TaxID=48710 RepID=A0ABP1PQS2_9HEXA
MWTYLHQLTMCLPLNQNLLRNKLVNQLSIRNFLKLIDCLYGKFVVPEDEGECYKCSLNASQPSIPVSVTDWVQEFFNCTDSCQYKTICTKAMYYLSENDDTPALRPLCYQCGNKKDEVVWFESKYEYELCSQDCQGCATLVDLTDAVKCAPICQGYPTFCFPVKMAFGQRICYQATHWYGCTFVEVNLSKSDNGDLDVMETGDDEVDEENDEESLKSLEECRQCALLVNEEKDARHCSYACSWHPTYHKTGTDNITRFYQCRSRSVIKDKHNQLFLYNVPDEIMEYIHTSNSSFVYPHNLVIGQQSILNGPVSKQVHGKFRIARMNSPLPYNDRIKKLNQLERYAP